MLLGSAVCSWERNHLVVDTDASAALSGTPNYLCHFLTFISSDINVPFSFLLQSYGEPIQCFEALVGVYQDQGQASIVYEEDLQRIQYGGAYSYKITPFFSSNVEILLVINRIIFPSFNVCFPFPGGTIKTCAHTHTYWGSTCIFMLLKFQKHSQLLRL